MAGWCPESHLPPRLVDPGPGSDLPPFLPPTSPDPSHHRDSFECFRRHSGPSSPGRDSRDPKPRPTWLWYGGNTPDRVRAAAVSDGLDDPTPCPPRPPGLLRYFPGRVRERGPRNGSPRPGSRWPAGPPYTRHDPLSPGGPRGSSPASPPLSPVSQRVRGSPTYSVSAPLPPFFPPPLSPPCLCQGGPGPRRALETGKLSIPLTPGLSRFRNRPRLVESTPPTLNPSPTVRQDTRPSSTCPQGGRGTRRTRHRARDNECRSRLGIRPPRLPVLPQIGRLSDRDRPAPCGCHRNWSRPKAVTQGHGPDGVGKDD